MSETSAIAWAQHLARRTGHFYVVIYEEGMGYTALDGATYGELFPGYHPVAEIGPDGGVVCT